MKISKDHIGGVIIFALIFLISLAAILYSNWLDRLPQNYTVGTIYLIGKPDKGNTKAYYKYYINNKEHENSVSNYGYKDMAKVGQRFLVEYPVGHNGAGVMLLDKPVPDNVVAPENGWDEIPDFAK